MNRFARVLAALVLPSLSACTGGACCRSAYRAATSGEVSGERASVPVPSPSGPSAMAQPAPVPVPASTPPVTTVDAKSGVSETKFANGLTLLVVPQPENPTVACTIWYAVGSRDEDVGESGLSHYLEHMLFKGTPKYPKGAIDKVTQQNGGSNNASTSYDRTEYHFTFPADRWRAGLEIEADRMRNSDVQPTEFDAEKNVVLQELKRNLGDPEDVLWEAVGSLAFRSGGYHHPVIGWPDDVITTTRERMKKYYLRHYTPDRATIVIVGGVDRQTIIDDVAARFSSIPRGEVDRYEYKEVAIPGETRLTIKDARARVPRLNMAFRSLSIRDPKEPWLDLVSAILSGDKTTRLEKALVEPGIAASADTGSDTRRDDGLFSILVEPTEGHSLDECEKIVRDVLTSLSTAGPTEKEVALARTKILANQVFSTESSMGLAERLGSLGCVTDWRYHLRYPEVVSAATPDDLKALAAKVFDFDHVVVGRGLPKEAATEPAGAPGAGGGGGGGGAGGGGGGGGGGKGEEGSDAERAPHRLDAGSRAPHRHDRDGAQAAAPAGGGTSIERALTLAPVREVLPNGLVVLALKRSLAPVFYGSLQVRDGRLGEAIPGLDAMTGSLLEEGTTEHTGEEIAAILGEVGGTLSAGGGGVTAKTLSKDAKLALSTMAEVATKPAFAADGIERVRGQQLQDVAQELETPRSKAERAMDKAVYGETHPLGRSFRGTAESVKSITADDVKAHFAKFWIPKNSVLVVVSDREPAEMLGLVRETFGSWKGGEKPVLSFPAIPSKKAQRIRLESDEVQTNILFGHLGIVRTDPDYVALDVMDNVLGTGAGFTDRLSRDVRDEKGLAYTVFANIARSSTNLPGTFRAYAGTNPEDAGKALAAMRDIVGKMLTVPPTPQELAGAKAALRGGMVTRLETASDVAGVLQLCERYKLGFDYPRRYVAEVEKITSDDVVRVAKAHLDPDAFVEVVIGRDAEKVGAK